MGRKQSHANPPSWLLLWTGGSATAEPQLLPLFRLVFLCCSETSFHTLISDDPWKIVFLSHAFIKYFVLVVLCVCVHVCVWAGRESPGQLFQSL